MSRDALKDIQQALNIIRSATDKEQYATKVKAMELVTQSLLSQIQTLKPLAVVKNKAQQKQSTARKPSTFPIPKSLNTPKSVNSPNAIVPNQPNTQANTASDNVPLNY